MAALMLLLAYILPLPILGACLYYHVFDGIHDTVTKLIALGGASLLPSALLFIFALKRIAHFIIHALFFAAVLYGLHHFGLLSKFTH